MNNEAKTEEKRVIKRKREKEKWGEHASERGRECRQSERMRNVYTQATKA